MVMAFSIRIKTLGSATTFNDIDQTNLCKSQDCSIDSVKGYVRKDLPCLPENGVR